MSQQVDIIIPLSVESKAENAELRIFLRSIDKNARNLGRVCIVSTNEIDWLQNVEFIRWPDMNPRNKDANIIDKLLLGMKHLGCEQFVLGMDDFVFNLECDLATLPVLYNGRSQQCFGPNFEKKTWDIWPKRVYKTFWLAEQMNLPLMHNYECHAPQKFSTAPILNGIR